MKNWKLAAPLAVLILVAAPTARAGHDDTSLVALRVTVSDVSGTMVTIDVAARGIDSSALSSAPLGRDFFYDHDTGTSALDHWTNAGVPPAIDWGDGMIVANTALPKTDYSSSTPTSGRTISFFAGQFMHTYAAPGVYTIRVFGTNVYANSTDESYTITSGNTFSTSTPGIAFNSGTSTEPSWAYGLVPIGITDTSMVTVSAAVLEIPTASTVGLVLLGLALAGGGFFLLRGSSGS
jgi:hypothetical protein